MKHYDWLEPGDPPRADFVSVRAKPLAKPIKHAPLTRENELELIRRFRDSGDLAALDQLVGAHRPMVVRMAKGMRRAGSLTLGVLVEYGMFGLRLAAAPPRPSLTKKGKMVGFDPTVEHGFSTYARPYAAKELRAALADNPHEPTLKADEFPKAAIEAENWHTAPSLRGILPDTPWVVRYLINRRASPKCVRRWTLWNPTNRPRKVRLRNYIKHPTTTGEWANKDASYGAWRGKLGGFEKIAKEGMEGWGITSRTPLRVVRRSLRVRASLDLMPSRARNFGFLRQSCTSVGALAASVKARLSPSSPTKG